jgi:hypothetical protein
MTPITLSLYTIGIPALPVECITAHTHADQKTVHEDRISKQKKCRHAKKEFALMKFPVSMTRKKESISRN